MEQLAHNVWFPIFPTVLFYPYFYPSHFFTLISPIFANHYEKFLNVPYRPPASWVSLGDSLDPIAECWVLKFSITPIIGFFFQLLHLQKPNLLESALNFFPAAIWHQIQTHKKSFWKGNDSYTKLWQKNQRNYKHFDGIKKTFLTELFWQLQPFPAWL